MSDHSPTTTLGHPRSVELTSDGNGQGRILVDDHDLSVGVSSINVDVNVGDVPAVSLGLTVVGLASFHGVANVEVDSETAAVLRLLGWTPPTEPRTSAEVTAAAAPAAALAEHMIRAAIHRLVAGDDGPAT